MKKIISIIWGGVLLLNTTSCLFEEKDIFEESAAKRLNDAIAEYFDLLTDSSNGWIMDYFPTEEQEGYTLLLNFNKNGSVRVAAKNQWFNNQYTDTVSLFRIIGDNGPVLTFDTYNEVLHFFSNPEDLEATKDDPNTLTVENNEHGRGLEGDYEFIVMEASENGFLLKGKKRGVLMSMRRLAENQDWRDYFNHLEEMNASLFNKNVPNLMMSVGDSLFTLSNGISHIFDAVPQGGDPITDNEKIPFIVTDYGIRLVKPFEVNETSMQSFKLSEDKGYLSAIEDDEIKITNPLSLSAFFLDEENNWMKGISWTIDSLNLGGAFKTAYANVVSGCKTVYKEDFNFFFFNYKAARKSKTLSFRSGTSKVYEGAFDFDILQNPGKENEIIFVDKETADNNGLLYRSKIDGFREIVELLTTSSFTLTTDSPLCPVVLKFTSVSNPDNWFTIVIE
jgi:hypothetical protein